MDNKLAQNNKNKQKTVKDINKQKAVMDNSMGK